MKKALLQAVAQAYITAQVQGILLLAQYLKRTVTYGEIAKMLGIEPWWGQLATALSDLMADDQKHGRPFLSALAVNATGFPGIGFFEQSARLLVTAPPAKISSKRKAVYLPSPAEIVFWKGEKAKLGVP